MARYKSNKSKGCKSNKYRYYYEKLKVKNFKSYKAKIKALTAKQIKTNKLKTNKLKTNKAILGELEAIKGRLINLESERIVLNGLEINSRYAAARKVARETMITAPFQFSEVNVNYLTPAVLPVMATTEATLFPVENLSIALTLNASVGQVKSLEGLGLIVYMVPSLDSEIPEFFALNFETTDFDKVDLSGSEDLTNHTFFDTVISNNNGSAVLTNGNTVLTMEEMNVLAKKQNALIPTPVEESELFYNQIYTFLRTDIEPIEESNNKNILFTTDPAILPRANSSFLAFND